MEDCSCKCFALHKHLLEKYSSATGDPICLYSSATGDPVCLRWDNDEIRVATLILG